MRCPEIVNDHNGEGLGRCLEPFLKRQDVILRSVGIGCLLEIVGLNAMFGKVCDESFAAKDGAIVGNVGGDKCKGLEFAERKEIVGGTSADVPIVIADEA